MLRKSVAVNQNSSKFRKEFQMLFRFRSLDIPIIQHIACLDIQHGAILRG